jgi:opacity protein-like surface antigen
MTFQKLGITGMLWFSIVYCALFLPVSASAADVEITPFAGYTMGGDFTETTSGTSLSLDDTSNYGIMIDIRQKEESWIELYFSRQQTQLRTDSGFLSGKALFDVDIDYYHIGGTYGTASGTVRPFVVGTFGATHLSPRGEGLTSETKFSLSLGGGVKLALTKHVGLRLDGRWFGTFIGGSGSVFCSSGACLINVQGDVISQFTANAGVILAF